MRRRSREINAFSVSALDLFASALGAFILMTIIFMVFFAKTSPDPEQLVEARAAVRECETERSEVRGRLVWCRGRLDEAAPAEAMDRCLSALNSCRDRLGGGAANASALAQCREDLAAAQAQNADLAARANGAAEGLARADAELSACRDELRRTFALVIMSWSTRDDVDLHVVDPEGREFFVNNKRARGTPAALEEDNVRGPGNEVWLHPSATPGRYRVCYKLYNRRGGSTPSVRGGVLWQAGKRTLPLMRMTRRGQVLLAAEIVVGRGGDVAVDVSQAGRVMGNRGCR